MDNKVFNDLTATAEAIREKANTNELMKISQFADVINTIKNNNAIEVYDSEERVVGVWFNKPLYRKSFYTVTPSELNKWSNIGPDEMIPVEILVSVKGEVVASDGRICSIPYPNLLFSVLNERLMAYISISSLLEQKFVFTIEYTKTTDVELSSIENM